MKKILIILLLINTSTYGQIIGVLNNQSKFIGTTGNVVTPSVVVPVVVIIGQSNADGGAFNTDFSAEINTFYSSDHPNLKIYHKPAIRNNGNGVGIDASSLVDDGEWWELTNGHDAVNKKTLQSIGLPASTVAIESNSTHGPESAMGKWWEENFAGEELRIIKFGIGATSLEDNWLPTGELYDIFMQYVYNPAIADILADGNTVDLIGVYWNQGESDNNNTNAPNYQTNLQTLISNFRTDSGIADARFVVSQLNNFQNTTNWNLIKAAQANVANTDANVDLIITDGSGIYPEFDTNPTDAIHFSSSGQTQLANAFWDVIYAVPTVANMLEEIDYFNAVVVPQTAADSLQWYVDTYDHVRLEKGFYGFDTSPQEINIGSNQSIYGHPSYNVIPNINILAGSSNVHLENLQSYFIDFLPGSPITNSVFKNIKYSTVVSTGGMIEDNLFVNLNSAMYFDMSASGYYKNNTIIRHQVQGPLALQLQGNNTTPTTGNIHIWSNYLTPAGEGAILQNAGDINFIGLDAEGWNFNDLSTDGAMFRASEMGNVKMGDLIGGAFYSSIRIPAFLIEADNLVFLNKFIWSQSDSIPNRAIGDTKVFSVNDGGSYTATNGINTRINVRSEAAYEPYEVYIDSIKQIGTITNQAVIDSIKATILDTQYTPIAKHNHETLPDPLGANWSTDRIGKPDSRAYIQNLIDTNNVAELPEGVFYISSTLNVDSTDAKKQGIIGSGTGKTVICGLTDDFPLITVFLSEVSQASINLSYLTLQGGSKGLFIPTDIQLFAFNTWKYVIFRNQNIGIHIEEIFGLDNNQFDYLSFVDCGTGILNKARDKPAANTPEYTEWQNFDLGYVDKTVFYRGQYINCDIGASITSVRASNLNLWQDCKFDGNRLALDARGNRNSMVVNSEFTNNAGGGTQVEAIIEAGNLSLYSCDFSGNTSDNVFWADGIFMEGCNLLDAGAEFCDPSRFNQYHFIINSVINGNYPGGSIFDNGALVNSTFAQQPELSKLLININDKVYTTVIDEVSNPYPQLLVKQ